MKYLHGIPFVAVLFISLCHYSCASRPDEELKLAQEAMEEAKAQHAAEFAPSEWESASEVYKQAQALVEKESYSQTRTLLLRAKSRFEKARDISKAKRDALLSEIEGMQKTIDLRYKTLKSDVEANAAKLSPSRKTSLEASFSDIDKGIEKLKAEIEQGEYTEAKTTSQTTMRQVYEAEVELQGYLGPRRRS